jgi:methionyl-tRNA synthetase
MNEPFYITTPIYYVNDEPHLGHAYTTILADVLARFARLKGDDTFFLTGTDEHGQKVQDAAQLRDIDPLTHANEMVVRFQTTWKELHIAYDDFIRTTETRHIRVVQSVLAQLWDQGEIYKSDYEGWYCVPDERFWTEKDLIAGKCPDCGREVERIVEPNYFFRMSDHQVWLVDYIRRHPDFVQPETRRNEVLGFLRQSLGDLCISRPVSRLSWGIPLPFDREYVTYVWFDALLNYVTAAGYRSDNERFSSYWSQCIHLIGKDILTTHAVYWPTMLHAAGLPQPKTIFAHGWWVLGGMKMSKSRRNVVKPLDLADMYSVDALRYFLMREMVLGKDSNFDLDHFHDRYTADLANDLGNLLHRLVHMVTRYFDGQIPVPFDLAPEDAQLRQTCLQMVGDIFELVETFSLNEALATIMQTVNEINRYLESSAPWKSAQEGTWDRVGTVLYVACEALRLCAMMLSPVMPERTQEIWRRLGWIPAAPLRDGLIWGGLETGSKVVLGYPLYPRNSQDEFFQGEP